MVFQVIMALVRRVEILDWFDRKLRGKNRYRCLRGPCSFPSPPQFLLQSSGQPAYWPLPVSLRPTACRETVTFCPFTTVPPLRTIRLHQPRRHHPPANSDPYQCPETVTFRPNIPETPTTSMCPFPSIRLHVRKARGAGGASFHDVAWRVAPSWLPLRMRRSGRLAVRR